MTSQAYHIRLAYQALPANDGMAILGLLWALFATVPSLIAIYAKARDWTGAWLTGGVIGFLSLLCLTPGYLGMIVLLSLE